MKKIILFLALIIGFISYGLMTQETYATNCDYTVQSDKCVFCCDNQTTTQSDASAADEEPAKKYKICPVCAGLKRCGGCGGSGQIYAGDGRYRDCSSCGGSGACGMCGGSGMIEDFGW